MKRIFFVGGSWPRKLIMENISIKDNKQEQQQQQQQQHEQEQRELLTFTITQPSPNLDLFSPQHWPHVETTIVVVRSNPLSHAMFNVFEEVELCSKNPEMRACGVAVQEALIW